MCIRDRDCPFYKNVRCETDCVVYEIPVLEFLRYVYGTTSTVAASELLGSAFGEPLAPIPKAPKPPTTTQMTGNMKVISARVKTLVSSLSLIHISEPTRLLSISYAVFCLKKKK
eukprot:TRINITY_DN25621_c0_g1_i1.p1 TRINITY_DN25621_c0_g1~~TRINITY_DN25621_c0_g1_i1.p1  ORF type:complete len:114 (-),score=22.19 TRINITY_DN25621_c0_g1_i1:75-416(-)